MAFIFLGGFIMKAKTHITWWFLLVAIAIQAVGHKDWFTLIDTILLSVSILVSCWIEKEDADDEDK